MQGIKKSGSKAGLIVIIAGLLLLVLLLSGQGTSRPASAAPQACVPGPHSGVITADEEWCLADSPHLLSGDVTVSSGVVVTIEPGVVVQGSRYVELLVEGHLEAVGTPSQPITFTSSADTGPTEWAGLAFDGGSGHLQYATVRYSGDRNTVSDAMFGSPYYRSAVTLRDSTLHLEQVTLRDVASSDSNDYGLIVSNSVVTLTDSLFTSIGGGSLTNGDFAAYVQGADSVLEMHGNTFSGNIKDRVLLVPDAMMGHDTTLYAQPVFDGYELQADFTVPEGITLTVEPGVVVQGSRYVELLVEGHLEAVGTPSQPITFTSSADTGPTEWAGLAFDGGSGHLQYATVRYSGDRNTVSDDMFGSPYYRSAVTLRDSTLHLEQVTLRDVASSDSNDHGLIVSNSVVTLTDSLFTGIGGGSLTNGDFAVYVQGADSVLEMHDNTFTANTWDRALLVPDAMMGHDTTLWAQPVFDGYQFQAGFTVPEGIALTVEPGVILRGSAADELLVRGHLQALGTPTQPITFTSVADSGPGQWTGLVFDGGTGHLRHATVRYGGQRNLVTDAGLGPWARSTIAIRDVLAGEVRLEDVTIGNIASTDQDMGIYVEDSNVLVENSLFTGIGNGSYYVFPDTPLYIAGKDSDVTLTNNTFTANNYNRVVLQAGAMMGHNTTLPAQDGLDGYVLENDFTVPVTVTMTVEPGVTVMGGRATNRAELLVEGHLEALGTDAQPITFTSFDDSGPGQWPGLVFDGSEGAGSGHLGYATVRYGGMTNSVLALSGDYHNGSNVTVHSVLTGELRLEHVTLEQADQDYGDHGLYVRDGRVSVTSSIIADNCNLGNWDSGVYVAGLSHVLIDNSVIQYNAASGIVVEGDDAFVRVTGSLVADNQGDGVENQGMATVILSGDLDSGNDIHGNADLGANQTGASGLIIATYNYWGDPSGPYHPDNPEGTGEPVSDRVLYDPWLAEAPSETPRGEVRPQAFGPSFVSPGETVNLGFLVHNVLTETLESTILVAHLPREAEYVQSSPNGEYWPQRHQVVWKLGDMAPDEQVSVAVQVRYVWGLASHLVTHSIGLIAAGNQPNEYLALDEYLSYEEVTITSFDQLSEQELAALLAADPDLNALYLDAESQGFAYYGEARSELLSTGDSQVSLPMIDPATPGESIYLYEIDAGAHRVHGYSNSVLGDSPTASFAYDYESGWLDMWPPFNGLADPRPEGNSLCTTLGCDDFGYDECLRNCLIRNLHSHQFDPGISQSCQACYKYGASCGICASHLAFWRSDVVKETVTSCDKACDALPESWKCDSDTRECANSGLRMVTPCEDCELNASNNYFLPCPPSTRCIQGDCFPIPRDPDTHPIEVLNAGDPNDMYGPPEIAPGQTVTYTIAFENVGEGTAYGVYVESQLPELFDPGALQIHNDGVYFSAGRTLMWQIGELGPGAGGSVSFEVQVPTGAISGTVVVASATVYFPSVPETTPTGDVVSIVRDIFAHGQWVETDEGVPVDVSLSGYSPTANPLTYSLVTEPLNGALSGSLPDLTYTPAPNFEGQDSFYFRVHDGLNTSRPAEAVIVVNTGAEAIPPAVLFTVPGDGATDVQVHLTPVITDTYFPTIQAQFDEPIDASTVTTDSFFVTNNLGQRLSGVVEYDSTSNLARFILGETLRWDKTYTGTVTMAVHDTSGNPMAADYVWSFRTQESMKLYLPVILKQ